MHGSYGLCHVPFWVAKSRFTDVFLGFAPRFVFFWCFQKIVDPTGFECVNLWRRTYRNEHMSKGWPLPLIYMTSI